MSDEQDKLKVSLEPPKLFGRKKKDAPGPAKRPAAKPAPEEVREPDPELVEEPVAEPEPEPEPELVEEPAAESAPEPEPEPEPEPDPIAETTVIDAAEESVEDTVVIATPAEVEATPEPEPAPVVKAPVEKAPTKKAPAKKPAAKKAAPKPVDEAAEEPVSVPATKKPARPRAKMAPPIEPAPVTTDDHDDAAVTEAAARDGEPLLALYPAASVTGAVVGGAMVLLTWLSLRGCEAVRDTSSCGGGPGLLLLLATFVVCILLGSTLLKTFLVPDPGSSSFLAVGLVAVIALLFLIDALDHWSMIIVIPVLSVGAFLASVWVTKTFVEPSET